MSYGTTTYPPSFPAGSEALPAAFDALLNGFEALPAGSETLLTITEAYPVPTEAFAARSDALLNGSKSLPDPFPRPSQLLQRPSMFLFSNLCLPLWGRCPFTTKLK